MTYKCLSIFKGKGRVLQKKNYKNGVPPPYGNQLMNGKSSSILLTMSWISFLIICGTFATIIPSAVAEMDYFPGLRRPPLMQNWLNRQDEEESRLLLAQLNSIIEEQARRRLQQHFQMKQLQQNYRDITPPDTIQPLPNPEFTYKFDEKPIENLNEDIPFAVSPSDPRYYDQNKPNNVKSQMGNPPIAATDDDYEESTDNRDDDGLIKSSSDGVPYFKLKAPMDVNPKFLEYPGSSHSRDVMMREEMNGMLEKLKHDGGDMTTTNNKVKLMSTKSDVIQKPMDIDSVMGMYVVALIAGISAAITVGLISIGIAWYTLHKKTKAAADVEYPAYGVTGPNKDISPSTGDRRLAQSAQMYHYQHQKQQIIAMENRSNNGDRNASLTDVESDDENEEGDYTVYECPGLAPTGEMEVKNPLFLDDPTPATPANLANKQSSPPPTTTAATVPKQQQAKDASKPTAPPPKDEKQSSEKTGKKK